MILPVSLRIPDSNLELATTAMLDSGATSKFIDETFVRENDIPTIEKLRPIPIHLIDGQEIQSGPCTHHSVVQLRLGPHQETIELDVTRLVDHPIVLGIPWLRQHNPSVDWKRNHVLFSSAYCSKSCILSPPLVPALPFVPQQPDAPSSVPAEKPAANSKPAQIAFVSAPAFGLVSRLSGSVSGVLPLRFVEDSVSISSTNSPQDPDVFEDELPDPPDYQEKLKTMVPPEYHDLLPAFSKTRADTLPPHRPYDHSIDLEPGTTPPYDPLYSLSELELKTLSEWLEENLSKGFIRASRSPAGCPVLFVKKKDGTLRLCVDYRGLNKITIKNRYPLPLIPEAIDRLHKAKVFTKLDLRSAFNLIRIKEGDEWKTAFRTRYGHFECLVMPFGLTNAPASMQHFVNDVFRDLLDVFVVIYIDDILIFSENPDDHPKHVRQVLERLTANGLYVKAEKSEFSVDTVEFLGYIISPEGVGMSPAKVEDLLSWPAPANVREVQQFLGFANFYRRFIDGYSRLSTPLTRLTRKDVKFAWSSEAQVAFETLKKKFTTAPVLKHFNPTLELVIETDASDFAISAILSQSHSGILHPVAFMSRKMVPAEQNYDVRDKELLALVTSIKIWRHYLEGSEIPFKALTDHESLKYFQSSRTLSRRQARWSEEINHHKYVIEYRPGARNGKADTLTRRQDFAKGSKASEASPQTILKPLNLSATSLAPNLESTIRKYLKHDPVAKHIIDNLGSSPSFSVQDGLLYHDGLVYIPDYEPLKVQILESCHDSPVSGHFGQAKTFELVTRNYYWPEQRAFVNDYVRYCDACQRNKPIHHKKFGLLQSLPIPPRPWSSVSLDHIVDLPPSNGFDCILVVVDRLTKMAHFIPSQKTDRSPQLASQFVTRIFSLHGLPDDLVSDRGPTFRSGFWSEVLKHLKIKSKLSTAFHPESDGQTERVNQVLEQYIRLYVNYLQDDWTGLLPIAEFAYNNSYHSSIGMTPFFCNYGYHPRLEVSLHKSLVPSADEWSTHLQRLHVQAIENLKFAQARHAKYANLKRSPSPEYEEGQKVWLLRRNIFTLRPSDKLDAKRLGPFAIERKVSQAAYRLKLPASMKIHPTFHVALLEPYLPNTLASRETPDPPPPDLLPSGQEAYEVEQILDSKILRKKLVYFVHWTGYAVNDRSWVQASDFEDDDDLVVDFHTAYPSKPGHERLDKTLS